MYENMLNKTYGQPSRNNSSESDIEYYWHVGKGMIILIIEEWETVGIMHAAR